MGCMFENEQKNNSSCSWCHVSTEESIHSRRCFMTGEYCSKQTNIQRERKKQHEGDDITIKAFVVMNFSSMSDVVYKWRIQPFIKSLSKFLYFDKNNKRLFCCKDEKVEKPEGLQRVKSIQVVRSDSDPASNYVVCNRICQQMQIADIVIVDVSSQNANVFYEFGMAVALGKLILPICYSESFYKMDDRVLDIKRTKKGKKQHIGCYPWRKQLFEYYGIRYRTSTKKATKYEDFSYAIDMDRKFADIQYNRFPYHEVINGESKSIGRQIYDRLKNEYNKTGAEGNTLVVYNLDGFMNEEEAGKCIVNFYRSITVRMRLEQCFCGERVGILARDEIIPEDQKDASDQMYLRYRVGEVIQIGVNQATYQALEQKLKTDDVLKDRISWLIRQTKKNRKSKRKISERRKSKRKR